MGDLSDNAITWGRYLYLNKKSRHWRWWGNVRTWQLISREVLHLKEVQAAHNSALPILLPDARSWKMQELVKKVVVHRRSWLRLLTEIKLHVRWGTNNTWWETTKRYIHRARAKYSSARPISNTYWFGYWKRAVRTKHFKIASHMIRCTRIDNPVLGKIRFCEEKNMNITSNGCSARTNNRTCGRWCLLDQQFLKHIKLLLGKWQRVRRRLRGSNTCATFTSWSPVSRFAMYLQTGIQRMVGLITFFAPKTTTPLFALRIREQGGHWASWAGGRESKVDSLWRCTAKAEFSGGLGAPMKVPTSPFDGFPPASLQKMQRGGWVRVSSLKSVLGHHPRYR